MLKKALIVYISTVLILFNLAILPVHGDANDGVYVEAVVNKVYQKTDVFNLKAKSSVLMDAETGTILIENNSHDKLPIASVTKIMSMLLIMEAIDSGRISMEDIVTTSEHASSMGGTQVWLAIGEQFTVKELMYAVTIRSANDCTVALAEHIAGSEEAFVDMMNEKAKELGMNDTHFLDCTGLTDEGHYSSAYDIAIMSRELINKHPEITEFTTQWLRTFREGKKDKEVMLDNTNKLLRTYTGTIGLKTGFTQKAGYCLSAVVKRSNLMLISVVLGEPDSNTRFAETKKIMDYGFANYETKLVDNKGEQVQRLSVRKGISSSVNAVFGDDVKLLLKKGNKEEIQKQISVASDLTAPIKTGQKIGEVVYFLEGKEVGKADLLAENDIPRATFTRLLVNIFIKWFGIGRR